MQARLYIDEDAMDDDLVQALRLRGVDVETTLEARLTVNEVTRETRKLKRIFTLRPDSPAIFTEWERLVAQHQVMGKQAHDARLVAAMKAHGLSHILTFNTGDFKRFTDITPVSPHTVA